MSDNLVERFSFSVEHEIAYEDVNGDWVKFAAYEALKQELDAQVAHTERQSKFIVDQSKEVEALKAENEALRKQVAELANETAKDHVKIMHLKDALSAYGDPDVFVDDED